MAPISNKVLLILLFIVYLSALPTIIGMYVYRNAKSNGMNSKKWTILAALLPCFSGFIIYLLVRRNVQSVECHNCGTPVEEKISVCPGCLNKLRQTCDSCQYPIEDDWEVCPKCGSKISGETSANGYTVARRDPSAWLVIISLILIPLMIALCISCNLFSELDDHYFLSRYSADFETVSGMIPLNALEAEAWYTIHHDEYADGIITSQTRINRVVWGGYSVEKKVPGKDSQMINLKTETASGGQLIDGIMHPLEVIEEYKNSNRTDRVVRAKYIRDDSGRIVQVEIIQGGNTSSDKGVIVQTNYFEYDEMNRIIKQTVAYINGDTRIMIYSYENDYLKNATEYDATGGETKQLVVNHKDDRTVIEVKSGEEILENISLEYDRQGRITRIAHEDPNGELLSETTYAYEFWNALAGVHGVALIIVAIFLTAFILVHTYAELINRRYKRAKSVTVYAKVLMKSDGGTETVPTAGHHIIVETTGGILNLAIEQNQYVLIREGIEGNLTHKGGWFESLYS